MTVTAAMGSITTPAACCHALSLHQLLEGKRKDAVAMAQQKLVSMNGSKLAAANKAEKTEGDGGLLSCILRHMRGSLPVRTEERTAEK